MNDEAIIELYFDRNERAIEETGIKYGNLCFDLANNIVGNFHDSQECVNDTYLTAWNIIPPNKPARLASFLCRITKNLALKKIEYNSALKRNSKMTVSIDELADCVSGKATPETEIIIKELSDEIGKFLRSQKQRDQAVFVKRYWFYESLSDIADELGTSEKNISLILFRMRQKLKTHLIKEGFDV